MYVTNAVIIANEYRRYINMYKNQSAHNVFLKFRLNIVNFFFQFLAFVLRCIDEKRSRPAVPDCYKVG